MKKYCIVGTGGRGTWMYADMLKKHFYRLCRAGRRI